MSNKKVMNISHTVYPPTTLNESDWMKEYNVSTLVPKYDGQERARAIMEQWQENKHESIFRNIARRLKVSNQ